MNDVRRLRRRVSPVGLLAAATLSTALLSACSQRVVSPARASAVAPALSVEAFLRASNERDYEAMARLFGTADGPVVNTGSTFGCAFKKIGSWFGLGSACLSWQDVEVRMAAIADVLRHEDYVVQAERLEPGREHPTNRISVDIRTGGRVVRGVPFLVVQSDSGSWLVEEIGLEVVTGS